MLSWARLLNSWCPYIFGVLYSWHPLRSWLLLHWRTTGIRFLYRSCMSCSWPLICQAPPPPILWTITTPVLLMTSICSWFITGLWCQLVNFCLLMTLYSLFLFLNLLFRQTFFTDFPYSQQSFLLLCVCVCVGVCVCLFVCVRVCYRLHKYVPMLPSS